VVRQHQADEPGVVADALLHRRLFDPAARRDRQPLDVEPSAGEPGQRLDDARVFEVRTEDVG
jgi:hypothetical protein